jgi:hypothetical protein
MNPRTGSDAAEPPSRPFDEANWLIEELATAEMARDWCVTASGTSDIV